jgi:hypothetical protein
VHTCHPTSKDEIFIYAFSTNDVDVTLTLEWGHVTDPDDLIETVITPTDGLQLVTPGLVLSNTEVITAFASVADVIVIYGFVNRIT